MRITNFENFVIDEIYDEDLYEEYLERNILKIDDEITEDRVLSEMKIDYLETSTLEYLEEISKVDFLSDEALGEKAMKGDVDSKDEVITKSLRIPILLGIILLKNGINYLDYRKTVQSIMAYKMADVDNITLIYSFYESLSEFICNYVNEIANDLETKDVVLCGNMFANSILLSKTNKTLSKNYNIILPKEYPLDY